MDGAGEQPGVPEIGPAPLQPAPPDPGRHRFAPVPEELLEAAQRDAVPGGDGGRCQLRIAEVVVDEDLDPLQQGTGAGFGRELVLRAELPGQAGADQVVGDGSQPFQLCRPAIGRVRRQRLHVLGEDRPHAVAARDPVGQQLFDPGAAQRQRIAREGQHDRPDPAPSTSGTASDSIGIEVSQSTMSPVNRPDSPRFWASDMAPVVTSPSWYCSGSLRRTWAAVRCERSELNSNDDTCTPPRSRTDASAQKSRTRSLRIAVGTSSCAITSVNQSSRSGAGTAAADILDHTPGNLLLLLCVVPPMTWT